ncbi:ATP-binding cassette sub-family B member 10, mitochondrial [Venturia canescens]|uniref:ATP-binding cassette sub-family B member 10, mitochondrial n=1 Tax=Venturia canescens TaxID=32260 RepID=UPI001C9D1AB5|nr:ATP-binding cassette sub-family B member 10, mitochondrial [Venturia canescens]XP_043284877.1 ATP-binding cassette sub-family B member 10, mitochondrial [Venturia canescens]XP_043284878.1 ATP-binding cassette sub-family B member 10, mitochondrial [Venturia canescens]
MTLLYRLQACGKLFQSPQAKTHLFSKCHIHAWRNTVNISKLSRKKIFVATVRWKSAESAKSKIEAVSLPRAQKKSELKRLLGIAAPEKWRLAGAIVLLIVSSTVTMAVPFCIGKIIDIIYTSDQVKTRENLNKLGLALSVVFLIGAVCNFGRVYLMSTTGHRITQALRKKLYSSIISQEIGMFDRVSTGELVGRLTGDTQLVSSAVTSNVSDGLRSTIMTIAGVSMMFYVSPQLTVMSLAVVPPVAALAVVYGRFVKKISEDVQNSLASMNTTVEERISNVRTVKAFAQETKEISRYSKKLNDLLQLCYKASFYQGLFFGMTGLSGNIIVLSVLYYGGVMITDATITVGNLSAFLLYAAYIGVSIGGLSSFYTELNRALGASTRVFQLIDRQPLIPISGGRILDTPLSGDIVFRGVSFKYPAREDCWILKDFNLHVSESSVTAIVGPSGSGKSTIASLLLRFYDPTSGSVLLDDHDLRNLEPTWVKLQIGFVSQEPILFSGSIKENIGYGIENASEDEIIRAAQQTNVLEFADKMPDGLNTMVGERGITLSGGQRQRVAIARALIKNPKIFILDEATSALDAESEHYVQEALERATAGRTVLTIAHRLSTIKNADRIAVLDQGRVIESGTYTELMQLENGLFKKLVKHQTFG